MIKNPINITYKIILASQSPRRHQLLKGLDLDFDIIVKPTTENFDPDMPVEEVPVFLAKQKAEQFNSELNIDPTLLIITADTIVSIENTILNKPSNRQDAIRMLKILSGKMHTVITGVCLKTLHKTITFSSRTNVFFKKLEDAEIEYYIDNYAPYDKAGSYGVQEWIGYICINKIEGSYYNVMGLPVQDLYEQLRKF
jgi:septum formation protein